MNKPYPDPTNATQGTTLAEKICDQANAQPEEVEVQYQVVFISLDPNIAAPPNRYGKVSYDEAGEFSQGEDLGEFIQDIKGFWWLVKRVTSRVQTFSDSPVEIHTRRVELIPSDKRFIEATPEVGVMLFGNAIEEEAPVEEEVTEVRQPILCTFCKSHVQSVVEHATTSNSQEIRDWASFVKIMLQAMADSRLPAAVENAFIKVVPIQDIRAAEVALQTEYLEMSREVDKSSSALAKTWLRIAEAKFN